MTDIEDTLNKIWTGQEQLAETLKQLGIGQAQQQREAPMPEPVRVFVSHHHSREEDEFTARLVADLQAAGAEVWVDVVGVGADDFQERINRALANSNWFILVLTPESIASPWVKLEVHAAFQLKVQGRMRGVIQVKAKTVAPHDIPPTWSTHAYFDATKDYDQALSQTLRELGLSRQLTNHDALYPDENAPAYLVIPSLSTQVDEDARVIELGREATIGRSSTCEIILLDDDTIAERHALLRLVGAQYEIADLGTSIGTFVNGFLIQEPTLLVEDDMIRIGSYEMFYRT